MYIYIYVCTYIDMYIYMYTYTRHLHKLAIEGLGGSLLGAEVVGFELVVLPDYRIQFVVQQQHLCRGTSLIRKSPPT